MKILIIVAHSDDEVLGCGGTVARLKKEGHEIFTLILGEGTAARYAKGSNLKKEIANLRRQAKEANEILGVKKIFFFDLPDNRFDSVDLLDIIKIIEKTRTEIKPDIIFTHYKNDLNIDHRITYNAVITATRPVSSETVKEIYSFEIPSSTEWNYPLCFSPDVFYDIEDSIKYKLEAIKKYKSELHKFPYPRSLEGIKLNAKYWGMKVGLKYAEAFKNVRSIK